MTATTTRSQPLVVVAEANRSELERVVTLLRRRFGGDVRVVGEPSVASAEETLAEAASTGDPVALVLAGDGLADAAATGFLREVRSQHPDTRRVLLVRWDVWADPDAAAEVRRASALGEVDSYVVRPWGTPDDAFVGAVAEDLLEWSRSRGDGPAPVTVVAEASSEPARAIRELLDRCGVPHGTTSPTSEVGAAVLRGAGLDGEADGAIAVAMPALGGRVLVDPTPAEVADLCGVATGLPDRGVDLVVVGAGPAGLACAAPAASEGLSTLVVERGTLGGHVARSSTLRGLLAFPRGISGADLTRRAVEQARALGAHVLVPAEVDGLRTAGAGHLVDVVGHGEVAARAVVLASGVARRPLEVPELEALVGRGVFHGVTAADARALSGLRVVVVGGTGAAGRLALLLARHAVRTTLVVREEALTQAMPAHLADEVAADAAIHLRPGTRVVGAAGDTRLHALVLEHAVSGEREEIPADGLVVTTGATPTTGWLPSTIVRDREGYVLTGHDHLDLPDRPWPPGRPPAPFETSLPGVFAIGDVRAGSLPRLAQALGEGSAVVAAVVGHLARQQAGRQ